MPACGVPFEINILTNRNLLVFFIENITDVFSAMEEGSHLEQRFLSQSHNETHAAVASCMQAFVARCSALVGSRKRSLIRYIYISTHVVRPASRCAHGGRPRRERRAAGRLIYQRRRDAIAARWQSAPPSAVGVTWVLPRMAIFLIVG